MHQRNILTVYCKKCPFGIFSETKKLKEQKTNEKVFLPKAKKPLNGADEAQF
jgi:hypothetical protein